MNSDQVMTALRSGALLHLEHREDEQVYWLSSPYRRVPVHVARVVLRNDEVAPQPDSLFEGETPQTWRVVA